MQARALLSPKKSQAVPSQQAQKSQLQSVNKHPVPTSTSRPTALMPALSRGNTPPLSALSRSLVTHPVLGQHVISQLQHSYGNRHVQRMLHVARQATSSADVESGVEQEIHRARGGGQPLDQEVGGQMESAFGTDFSGVRVHADSHADTLNRSLNARAFTTGRDIFFRQGAYNPGSSGGRELLAHELTHVVQQTGGAVRAKMVVNQPGDRFEQEADQAARAVIQREQQAGSTTKTGAALQRQAEEEAEPVQAQLLQRQTMEDEEAVQARFVQRQAEEDDESVQMQRVQRQMEEDESVQTQLLQRQSEEDDESVQMQRLQRQTEDEEPVQTRLAQRQSEDDEPVQMQWIQRQAAPATAEAEPTEAEKAAALAAARMAEQLANQALAEGKNEVVKSRTAQAEAKSMGQAAKQEAEAKSLEVPAEAAYAAATQTGSENGEQPAGEMTDEMASETAATSAPTANGAGPATVGAPVAVNGAGPGAAVNGKAPSSAEEDADYQSVIKRIKGVADTQQAHAPAKSKADESQAAAESPSSEIEGKAQANQVDAMEQAEAPPFDASAFKAQLLERIAALAPKTIEEADNFKKDDKLAGVKSDMQARAQEEQTASQAPLEAQTAAPPDTSRVEPKPVTPLSPAEPGPAPADVGAASAAPKSKGASEVEAPLAQNSRKLGDEMGDVEESDLEKSNEPAFLGALASKREAQTHAQTAPQAYRQAEGEQLAQAEAEAAGLAQDRTQAMHGDRAQLLTQAVGQQGQAKSKDEQAREKVAADIQKIYDETKTSVETILSELDGKVEKAFDEGAAAAKQVFEDFVKAKMDAYKERRYGGWLGWARWAKDKLLGMPSEVNVFYQDGRDLYLRKMEAVIDNVVAIVGTGITEAKAEIARGKERIQAFVEQLPADLQAVGQQAASDIQDKFADLEQSVADKQSELADTLANKYQENLQAIDARIEEMKAANQGLVDKAINAVVGVVKAILKLKDLLFSVLAKIASVVTKIIKAPIEFLGNLVKGVKQGFTDFVSRISTHLQAALIAWLTGALGPVGIQVPDDLFSLPGIFSLVMQVLGLTWDYIRAKAVKLLGEPVVKALETGFEVFQILIRDGVAGLWEFVKEEFTNLKEMVIDQIKEMVITEVIKAGVKWILGLLNPVGAFIKAAMAIYEIVKFFVERGSQIIEMVNAFIDAVAAIASGALGGAAKLVENALAKALPVVIGFLASLLGISGLAKKVQKLIMSLRKRIDKAIDKLILKAKKFAKKLFKGKKGKDLPGKFTEKDRQAGLKAFALEEKPYIQNNAISYEDAKKTAVSVKNKYSVFKSITVIDGKDSWNYQYIFRAEVDTSAVKEKDVLNLIDTKIVERVEGSPDRMLIKEIPEGYLMPIRDNRIYIRRRDSSKVELPEVHIDDQGFLKRGPAQLPSLANVPAEYREAVAKVGTDRTSGFWQHENYIDKYYNRLKSLGIAYDVLINNFVQNNDYGMGADEAHAIFGYTTVLFYERLNRLLREGVNPEKTDLLTGLLKRALGKLPLASGVQYRGIKISDDALPGFLEKHKVGGVVTYEGFLSAANMFTQPLWGEANTRFTIHPTNARDVTELAFGKHFIRIHSKGKRSNDPHESLFMPNSRFQVDAVESIQEERDIKDENTKETTKKVVAVYNITLRQVG